MPIHDWTRVSAGTFHDFHCSWIIHLKDALNNGVLPANYYAAAEQKAGRIGPDVLTLQVPDAEEPAPESGPDGATAVSVAPPKVRIAATADTDYYAKKQRSLVIRRASNDRMVALIEILSPGNKDSRRAIRAVLRKVVAALQHRLHLLLVDVLPPSPRDPQGIHGVIWDEIGKPAYVAPPDKSLTLAAYEAADPLRAFIEPVAVGDVLAPMPLFLKPGWYVSAPLEESYMAAYQKLPRRWRDVLNAPA
jgi:hypothetical protein